MSQTSTSSRGFGRGGNRHVHLRMTLYGSFTASFSDFITAKAKRLSIEATTTITSDVATIEATGPSALVGALEMAACIAPDDCQVTRWDTAERTLSA